MKKLFTYIFTPLVILAMVAYLSAAPLTGDGIQGGSGTSFSVTDITGQTDDTTPATTATAVLAQGGSLIESTLAEIATAVKGSYFGTLTNTKWCTTNGTLVACTENAPQPALGLLAGTLTNTYLCKYTAAGTLLSCDVDPATYQAADADLTTYAGITPSANVQTMLGSANNAAIVSNIGAAPASGIALTALANQAANTVNANATTGAAAPTAVAIAEQQIVGRLTGGNIKGLSAAEVLALAAAAPAAGSTSVVSYGPTALQEASCTANALTLTPTAGLGIVNISITQTGDANCAITMGEASAVEGTVAIIKNVSDGAAETLTFTSSANVLRLIQGSPFAMAINETLILQYKNSEWLEIGRASGSISVDAMDVPGASGKVTKIGLDAVGIADAAYNGTTITLACGEDITAPAPVYVKSDGKAWKANAAAAATMPAIGLMVETCDVDASESKKILIHGVYRKDASYAFTVGSQVYIDDSAAGVLTHTVGDIAGTDHVVQVFGIALDADYLLVNPSLSTITLE